jgi:hypothetical protein
MGGESLSEVPKVQTTHPNRSLLCVYGLALFAISLALPSYQIIMGPGFFGGGALIPGIVCLIWGAIWIPSNLCLVSSVFVSKNSIVARSVGSVFLLGTLAANVTLGKCDSEEVRIGYWVWTASYALAGAGLTSPWAWMPIGTRRLVVCEACGLIGCGLAGWLWLIVAGPR